ncbi:MAG TPA: tryptophan synthase subunit beta [Candidatus Limnocylindrales bacterium]|nr:tryptophan synthase subunit beta [Candidatus Limnocylindrales bacterium]
MTTRTGIVHEIAARRAADLERDLAGRSRTELERLAAAAPPPRPIAERLAEPGLHLIAEIKRASPSAGAIAADTDPIARARAYEAGGAAAISVLCEPHWFGGSVDDLVAVRGAVSVPVVAKEFVVDRRQLPLLRAAGADVVLLLAVLHPARRLASLVRAALDLGLEPLVEAHDAGELERALATDARLVGVNNRDLRTLEVDPERAVRLRDAIPGDRLAVAESGVRDAAVLAGWRAVGYDAALVGEALMRSPDPRATAASFVAAGRMPADPAASDRVPFVKICGVTDEAGALAAVRAGADAIGLNLAPGTPRELSLAEAAGLAAVVRAAATPGHRPQIVAITVDADAEALRAIVAAVDPDAIQLHGDESPGQAAAAGRPVWRAIRVPVGATPDDVGPILDEASVWSAAGAERILLDASGGPHPGGTGRRIDPAVAAAVAREVPVLLAGGLDPTSVSDAVLAVPAIGVDVAGGAERPREPGVRPVKDPLRVALFVKRARAARWDRPQSPARPTPVPAGLLEADATGRWGIDRAFGGRYVPETLVAALVQLEDAYAAVRDDPRFWSEFRELLGRFAGRPTPLYRADRWAADALARARASGGSADHRAGDGGADREPLPSRLRVYLKREDLAHTGAHKINNALGQALLTRRLGKTRVIAETGAGQHGVATATACALLGIPCVVYMGAEDVERQAPNVSRMRSLGAEVIPVTSGSATLKDAINEAMRDWVTNVATTHYVLGSAMGPHPYPTIVRDLQRVIGDEAAAQLAFVEGRLPDLVLACVGGGSNAIGLLSRFIGEPSVRLALAEAAGDGIPTGRHAAALLGGSPGILHGARSLMLQDADGQVVEAHSLSAGLDYPGVGPQIAALYEAGRLEVAAATDAEAVEAVEWVTRTEGILPALETAHAFAVLPRLLARTDRPAQDGWSPFIAPWPEEAIVLVGLSGRGDKDLAAIARWEAAVAAGAAR